MEIITVKEFNEKFKPKAKKKKGEESLHAQVCRYIDLKYSDVIYMSDSSGVKLNMGQAVKLAKTRCKNYKIPDLIILKPVGGFAGLIIEIKISEDEVYTKKGQMRESEHIQKQWQSLKKLSKDGYMAVFGCGYDNCIKIIDNYFKL